MGLNRVGVTVCKALLCGVLLLYSHRCFEWSREKKIINAQGAEMVWRSHMRTRTFPPTPSQVHHNNNTLLSFSVCVAPLVIKEAIREEPKICHADRYQRTRGFGRLINPLITGY